MCIPVVQILLPLLDSDSPLVYVKAMWALRAVFATSDVSVRMAALGLVSPQHILRVLSLCAGTGVPRSELRSVQGAAMRVLSAVVSITDAFTPSLFNSGLLGTLAALIPTLDPVTVEASLHLLANLTCTEAPQGVVVGKMLEAGVFAATMGLGLTCIHPVRLNRAYFMAMSARAATPDQIVTLLGFDLVRCLGEGMALHDPGTTLRMLGDLRFVFEKTAVGPALDAVNPAIAMAEECGINAILFDMANARTKEVAKLASDILDKYFPDYEDEKFEPTPAEGHGEDQPLPDLSEMRRSVFSDLVAHLEGAPSSSTSAIDLPLDVTMVNNE